MATNKKHIAVYLDPLVEQALIDFCEQKGLKSKKGFMYSTGVNAVLAEFFGIADTDLNNLGVSLSSKILAARSNIPNVASTVGAVEPMKVGAHVSSNALPVRSNIPNAASTVGSVEPMKVGAHVSSNALPVRSNIPNVASTVGSVEPMKVGAHVLSNALPARSNIPTIASNISNLGLTIPSNVFVSDLSDILPGSIDLEVLPGKFQA